MRAISLFVLLSITGLFVAAEKSYAAVKVGDVAPDFSLMDSHGNSFTLSQQRGKTVEIFFLGYS